MKRLAFALLFAAAVADAQSPYLVKDINTTSNTQAVSSSPFNFFRFGSRIYFATGQGAAIYSTDGTEAGTSRLVLNLAPTGAWSFASVNGKLLFNARDGHYGEELWVTDGTSAGTHLLADINPTASSSPSNRIVYHDRMLFSANDGLDGVELWITDGTPTGTRLVKDLEPGTNSSFPRAFVIANDTVYFGAGTALWKSDGTEGGTVKLKDGVDDSQAVVAGSRIFFIGSQSATGRELWVSDGTESGTHIVVDLRPGSNDSVSYFAGLAAFGDRVLFVANDGQHGDELWISDGTEAGTHLVRDITPGSNGGDIRGVAVLSGMAYFGTGSQLWKTDGTEAGTSVVTNLSVAALYSAGGRLFIVTNTGALFVSDGTDAGTRQVKTSSPLSIGGSLTYIDGLLYFSATNNLNGYEPWKSDGTDAGTTMIANLGADPAPSSVPANLTTAADWLYFTAWDGLGSPSAPSLWRSDGTPEGTLKVANLDAGPHEYISVGRSLFFTNELTLWLSGGTPETTAKATEFSSRFGTQPQVIGALGDTVFALAGYYPSELYATTLAPGSPAVELGTSAFAQAPFVNFAGRAMFFAPSPDGNHSGLWTSDGTRAGTYAVVPDFGGYASFAAVAGGYLYFAGGTNVWKSDGTFAGTVLVKTLTSQVRGITAAGKNLFFTTENNALLVSDGTDAGTRLLPPPVTTTIAAIGDKVVFASGGELWVSDGTTDGTKKIPGPVGLYQVTGSGTVVYFTAFDTVHGSEVWITDGTPEGTRLAGDLEPGTRGSSPADYVRTANNVFFTATTTAGGKELWTVALSMPRLSINDVRVTEGDSGTTTARFTVTLSTPAKQSVTVDYATSDGTASAGSDYDAASGSIPFAPGETSKSIDVAVRGDSERESNESFFVNLRNASGAAIEKSSGFALIEDDDVFADLSASLDFSLFSQLIHKIRASNSGPETATSLSLFFTSTPGAAESDCNPCPLKTQQIAPGATIDATAVRPDSVQQFFTATVAARQRDPRPSNNSVAWTSTMYLALDALYLTPGATANVWWYSPVSAPVRIESSDPSIISAPSGAAIDMTTVSGFVTAHAVGRVTLRAVSPSQTLGSLTIDVVAPGTKPRWPGGVDAGADPSVQFDKKANVYIAAHGLAPFSGMAATGRVTITAKGQPLGSVTLTGEPRQWVVPISLPDVGKNDVVVSYEGDANFLPTTSNLTVTATRGYPSIAVAFERSGAGGTFHVSVAGVPAATPTGTITIQEPLVLPLTQATLTQTAPGVAHAGVSFTNVTTAPHTLIVIYSGDSHYFGANHTLLVNEGRRRAVGR